MKIRFVLGVAFLLSLWSGGLHAIESDHRVSVPELSKTLHVGDVIFIHIAVLPFEKVSATTQSWANHVGVVVEASGEPIIAESTFPVSRTTPLSRFVARSDRGRVAIARLHRPLTEQEANRLREAGRKRLGLYYDSGFDLYSSGQFCSRFVREVLAESTGISVGEVETFKELLARNPKADLDFWRLWYFGSIPWERETVTPASVQRDIRLHTVFDGFVGE